jgi:hypothetical protein
MSRKIRITFAVFAIIAMASLVQATLLPTDLDANSAPLRGINPETGISSAESAWNGGPRECDLPNGISTACIFMD